jgi:hypothetical protein
VSGTTVWALRVSCLTAKDHGLHVYTDNPKIPEIGAQAISEPTTRLGFGSCQSQNSAQNQPQNNFRILFEGLHPIVSGCFTNSAGTHAESSRAGQWIDKIWILRGENKLFPSDCRRKIKICLFQNLAWDQTQPCARLS